MAKTVSVELPDAIPGGRNAHRWEFALSRWPDGGRVEIEHGRIAMIGVSFLLDDSGDARALAAALLAAADRFDELEHEVPR